MWLFDRRHGIGSSSAGGEREKHSAFRGIRHVLLETSIENEAAVAFWQHHGYRIEAVLKRYYLGRLDAYEMRKILPAAAQAKPAQKEKYSLYALLPGNCPRPRAGPHRISSGKQYRTPGPLSVAPALARSGRSFRRGAARRHFAGRGSLFLQGLADADGLRPGRKYPGSAPPRRSRSTSDCSGTWSSAPFPAQFSASYSTNRSRSICVCRGIIGVSLVVDRSGDVVGRLEARLTRKIEAIQLRRRHQRSERLRRRPVAGGFPSGITITAGYSAISRAKRRPDSRSCFRPR